MLDRSDAVEDGHASGYRLFKRCFCLYAPQITYFSQCGVYITASKALHLGVVNVLG